MKRGVIVFGTVFLLVLLALFGSLVSAATEYYGFKDLRAGVETTVHGTDESIPVQELRFVFNTNVKEAWIELQSFTALPPQVVNPAEGNQEVYKYLHFRKSAAFVQSKLDSFEFELLVKKSWLEKHGVDLKTVKVEKYENDAWLPVDLQYKGEDDTSVVYRVASVPALHVVLAERASNLPKNPEEGNVSDVAQEKDTLVTGAAIADAAPQGYGFAWAILAVLILILAVLAVMYYTSNKSNEVFPQVSNTETKTETQSAQSSENEPEKKLFTVSDEELAKNREQVRRELGL